MTNFESKEWSSGGQAPNPGAQNPMPDPALYAYAARREAKRLIRSDAGKAAGLVLIYELIVQGGASVFALLYQVFNMVTGIGMTEPVLNFVTSYLPVIVFEVLVLIIALFWFKTDVAALFQKPTLEQGEKWKGPAFMGLGLGAIQLGSLIYTLYYMLFHQLGVEISVPEITANTSNMAVNVLTFLYVCICGSFMEEVFFRGILFQKMRKHGDVPAVFFTAILFALFHMNFVQLPGPFLFGVAAALLYSKTNSLWYCIALHMLNNTIYTIADWLPSGAADYYSGALTIITLLLGIACFILLFKDLADIFKNRKGNCTVLSCGEKFGAMLGNIWFIVFLVFWFGLSLFVQLMA